ncbi:MAG: hypothetical protein WC871_02345 [Bacteroidales bacterium]|jgi:hypothetical protein
MANMSVDLSSFKVGIDKLTAKIKIVKWGGILDVANEVLRLSQFEVPHDTGRLQNSGHVEPQYMDHATVGYNTVYAARLHENPQFRFRKGRKGKYLEDPIKHNLAVFKQFFEQNLKEALG